MPDPATPSAVRQASASWRCQALALAVSLAMGCGRVGFDPMGDSYEPRCAGSHLWSTELTEDPTTLDRNGDGVADWVMRDGGPFPVSELANGVWSAPATVTRPLDTWPAHDFETRTVGTVRMRNLSSADLGTVMWMNVGSIAPGLIAVHVDLERQPDGSQTLTLSNWSDAEVDSVLAVVPDLDDGFVEAVLDVDPVGLTVAFEVDGLAVGTYGLSQYTAPGSITRSATVVAFDGASEFESVTIESCP